MFGGRRLLINSQQLFFQRPRQNYWLIPNIKSHDLTVSKRTLSNPYVNKAFIISSPSFQNFVKCNTTYSSFYNLIAAISRVLIDQHLIFAHPRAQHAVIRLENVRQLNIRRDKKFDIRVSHRQPHNNSRNIVNFLGPLSLRRTNKE